MQQPARSLAPCSRAAALVVLCFSSPAASPILAHHTRCPAETTASVGAEAGRVHGVRRLGRAGARPHERAGSRIQGPDYQPVCAREEGRCHACASAQALWWRRHCSHCSLGESATKNHSRMAVKCMLCHGATMAAFKCLLHAECVTETVASCRP